MPVVYDFARGARARTLLTVIITIGAVSAMVGLVQYAILNYGSERRLQGTLSHWMTYSGTLMLVICAAAAACSTTRAIACGPPWSCRRWSPA